MQHLTHQIPAERAQFFASRHFEAELEIYGQKYTIQVQTPDLTSTPVRMWADWGPMYTCTLDVDQLAEVTYVCTQSGRSATYHFSPPRIAVNSPAWASERVKHPFFIEVIDTARCLKIRGFMNADGVVQKTTVRPIHRAIDVPALIFREADASALDRADRWTPSARPGSAVNQARAFGA